MNAGSKGGRLTTHVLDTMAGRPAAGLLIELFRLEGGDRAALATVRTNADGRVDGPLLEGEELRPGIYQHFLKYKERGEKMPAAVILGAPAAITAAGPASSATRMHTAPPIECPKMPCRPMLAGNSAPTSAGSSCVT